MDKIINDKEILIKENENKIKIIYTNNKKKNEINIFGEEFVKNNINKCKIIYNNEKYDLQTKFNSQNINQLEIELLGILNISDMS